MAKVVHVIDNLMLGGAEVLLYSTIKRLPQFEHHIILLSKSTYFKDIDNYARLYILQHTSWHTTLRTCARLKKIIDALQPHVVHAHLFLSSFIARLSLREKYNLIYSIHNLYSKTIFKKAHLRWMEKFIFNKHHKVIAVSQYVLEDYKKVISRCNKGYVLYNFIDDAFIMHRDLKKVPPPGSLHKWVAVGSFKEQKNYPGLIRLFEGFYKAHPQKGMLSLDIYGDGPLRTEIEAQIKGLGLPVYLKGRANGLATLLKHYDAYISTSHYEGYGIAPMEALAIGLPVFLNAIPVYEEIYKEHAFFFDVNEPGAITFSKAYMAYEAKTSIDKQSFSIKGQQYAATIAGSESYLKSLLTIYNIEAS